MLFFPELRIWGFRWVVGKFFTLVVKKKFPVFFSELSSKFVWTIRANQGFVFFFWGHAGYRMWGVSCSAECLVWLQSRKTFAFLLGLYMKAGVGILVFGGRFRCVCRMLEYWGSCGFLVLCAQLVMGFMIGKAVLQGNCWYVKLGVTYCVQVVAVIGINARI